MNNDAYIDLAVTFQNDVMKSILYVAIFVLCMFLLSGVLRSRSANNKLKDALETFIGFFKRNDFVSLIAAYPSFIEFSGHAQLPSNARVEDILQLQQALFEEAASKYRFADIADIKIEKINRQAFQYEQKLNTKVIGQLVYTDGSSVYFGAILQQDKMLALMISNECVLNNKCKDYA